MKQPVENNGVHAIWPAERFYWGVLDASLLERAHRRNPKRLAFLFEPLLPVPIDAVHAVYLPLDDRRVLACAAPHETLEGGFPPYTLSLSPAALPEHLEDIDVDPARLNLLTGRFTPRKIRLERRRLLNGACAAIALLATLIAIGLHRRTLLLEQAMNDLTARTNQLYADVLGPNVHASTQPPALQLTAERRRLQQTRSATDLPAIDSVDLAIELEQLFRHWPNEAHLNTETITLSPEALTIRASLPAEEMQQVLGAIQAWATWQRVQPEVTNQRGQSSLTLRFKRDLIAQEGASQ